MNRKLLIIIPLVAVMTVFIMSFKANTPVAAATLVYIRADGSVDPSTAPISSNDNITYTFSGNIYVDVVVERNNIIVDGKGYAVQGQGIGSATGIFLAGRRNVTIKNVIVKAFDIGIWLGSTSNSIIYGNNITDSEHGIQVGSSDNNTFSRNNITNNDFGLTLQNSSNNNLILGNNIANNAEAIWLLNSSKNTIYANDVMASNDFTMLISYSSNNTIYSNNFENDNIQMYIKGSKNVWDGQYPCGGNHWSDYSGTDVYSGPFQNQTSSDGIGDKPKTLDANNTDNYPLMGMFYDFPVTLEDHSEKQVQVISNSSIHDLHLMWDISSNEYLQPNQKFIRLHLSGPDNTTGFCRVTIPRTVLNGTYAVFVDSKMVPVYELAVSNSTHAYLYFTYRHTAHEVIIVPEFPPFTILPLFMLSMMVTLAATSVYRRKKQTAVVAFNQSCR